MSEICSSDGFPSSRTCPSLLLGKFAVFRFVATVVRCELIAASSASAEIANPSLIRHSGIPNSLALDKIVLALADSAFSFSRASYFSCKALNSFSRSTSFFENSSKRLSISFCLRFVLGLFSVS